MCGTDVGPQFGSAAGVNACVPPHCLNRVADAGESGADCGGDCGGDCGTSCSCPTTNGAAGHCRTFCPCASGHGNCNNNDECGANLVCGGGRATRYGLSSTLNVCVPQHCLNNIKDAGESTTDCGAGCGCVGPCAGAPCP
jgi:hypothetical protein